MQFSGECIRLLGEIILNNILVATEAANLNGVELGAM